MKMVLDQIIVLLPILIIGITVICIMVSIIYKRNHFRNALLALIGLILAALSALGITSSNSQGSMEFLQLIHADTASILYIILIMITSVSSVISGYTWLSNYPTDRRDEFYLLLLISSMGGVILAISNHLVVLFLGIELVAIPLFGLISYPIFQKRAIAAGIKYIILSGVSSSFLLFGIACIYCSTGCLSFIGIKEILLLNHSNIGTTCDYQSFSMLLVVTGIAMMIVSISFKLSLMPFHLWTPDIYQGAPSSVSMYLSTTSKIGIISVLIRFLMILPDSYSEIFYIFLLGSACCSMLFSSLLAIYQNNIKRILAYSSITHTGYLLTALIALRVNNYSLIQETVGIYLISYVISNIGVFSIINLLSSLFFIDKEKEDIDINIIYYGLFWREPILSVIFIIIILSLAGIPLTLGFIGKFYILLMGIGNQLWLSTICIVISSIVSLYYYLKIIINLFNYPNSICINYHLISFWNKKVDGFMLIIIAIIILFLGVYPQSIINLIRCII